MRAKSSSTGNKRKGVILLVVLAMLTLLTVLGITFVLYADSSEATARINLESEKIYQPQYTEKELLQHAIGQLVFDVEDDTLGQQSAIRGHSLARDMYGYHYSGDPFKMGSPPPLGTSLGLNDRPFRGTGRLENDKFNLNFSTFYISQNGTLNPEQIRDPERLGARSIPNTPNAYVGGFNPPYTYADLNHVFLAKLGSDGQVDEASFVRREAIGSNGQPAPLGTFNGSSWDFNSLQAWSDQAGKYRMVRPRPAEHPMFPQPADGWGDVRNLPWGTHNDAVWIDLGVEPKTAPNGRKYKPLFAFTVLDLDGRVNVNAHGNLHRKNIWNGQWIAEHASGIGTGPWDVSLQRALLQNPKAFDWSEFRAFFSGNSEVTGRHRSDLKLSGRFQPPPNQYDPNNQHTHGPLDFNGSADFQPTNTGTFQGPLQLPGKPAFGALNLGSYISPFGVFMDLMHGGSGLNELTSDGNFFNGNNSVHGSLFNPYESSPGNKLFPHSSLGLLMGRSTRNSNGFENSELYKIGVFKSSPFLSQNRDDVYNRLTTLSWDLDRPGVFPLVTQRAASESLQFAPNLWIPNSPLVPGQNYPSSNPVNFPSVSQPAPLTGEFDSFFRSNIALAQRLDLKRKLIPFPPLTPNGTYTDIPAAIKAMSERQAFALDIFHHLSLAAGTPRPGELGFVGDMEQPTPTYAASKWLAQLAANLVDQIDNDEVMTVFQWSSSGFADSVVGVELSRINLNEVFVQVENDPVDLGKNRPTNDFKGNIYLELHNPLLPNANRNNPSPLDSHEAVIKRGNQVVHALALAKAGAFTNWNNPLVREGFIGPLAPAKLMKPATEMISWSTDLSVLPAVKPYPYLDDPAPGNVLPGFEAPLGTGTQQGFLVVGPKPDPNSSGINDNQSRWVSGNSADIVYQPDLSFTLPKETTDLANLNPNDLPIVLLRRLAIPGLEHQPDPNMPDPAKPFYNPYITIDFIQITPDMLKANDARKIIIDKAKGASAVNSNPDEVKNVGERKSYGKNQPFYYIPASAFPAGTPQSRLGLLSEQQPVFDLPNSTITGAPKTTFWRQNTKSNAYPNSYRTLANDTFETPKYRHHLDRAPANLGELLSTPTCRTHELVLLNNDRAEYCAGWMDSSTRLYRFLEFVQAGDTRILLDTQKGNLPVQIGSHGGRIPGKINVNTMSYATFKALCDAQINNRFTDQQVDQIWKYLSANRPFWGFGVGENPGIDQVGSGKRGMNLSLLRNHPGFSPDPFPAPNSGSLTPFDATDQYNLLIDPQNSSNNNNAIFNPPYDANYWYGFTPRDPSGLPVLPPVVRQELLSKIIGNTTSRSNCFAVWLTVGFFEVVSDQGNPTTAAPKYILGKEMQPRTRRRMFSLVDRTMLEAWRLENIVGLPQTVSNATVSNGAVDQFSGQLLASVPVPLSQLSYNGPAGPINLATGTVFQSSTGKSYPIAPGSVLTFDPNTIYEETVEVVDLGMGTLGVVLHRPHGVYGPVTISSRGNPGPIPRENIDLDDLKNFGLIPYFQVLE